MLLESCTKVAEIPGGRVWLRSFNEGKYKVFLATCHLNGHDSRATLDKQMQMFYPSSSACVIMPIQPKPIKFPIILDAWLGNCMKTASQIVKTPSAALLWRIATSIFDDTATYIKAHKLTVEQQQPAACRSPAYRRKKRLLSVCLFPSYAHRHLDTQMIWSVPVFGGKNYSFGVQKESVWFSLTVCFFSFLEEHLTLHIQAHI